MLSSSIFPIYLVGIMENIAIDGACRSVFSDFGLASHLALALALHIANQDRGGTPAQPNPRSPSELGLQAGRAAHYLDWQSICQLRSGPYGYSADVVTRRRQSPDRIAVRSLTVRALSDVRRIVRDRLCLLVRRSAGCA